MTMHGTNICKVCGHTYHKFCGTCAGIARAKHFSKKQDELSEKSSLKLYEVRVLVESGITWKPMLVTILATDSSKAMSHAEISLGVQLLNLKAKSTWTELQGPFKNGQVLAVREDDF